MSEIPVSTPDDIDEVARRICYDELSLQTKFSEFVMEIICHHVAAGIRAERERCAQLPTTFGFMPNLDLIVNPRVRSLL
ncbi:hypothetical protein ACLE20_04755 [Rhizobium sp. YIM 134829]|uniref:hypothetical protein n=1 Tax=Rhizobium sp. YIM 134829 TaxID=3390453 RepID=UPI00397D1737